MEVCSSAPSLGFFEFIFCQRRDFLFACDEKNVLSVFLLDPRLSIWSAVYQVYLLEVSLLQWNLTVLIMYLKVLPFHSHITNEFFPMTSSFLSVALSLILSHLLYFTSLLHDTVRCMEVLLSKAVGEHWTPVIHVGISVEAWPWLFLAEAGAELCSQAVWWMGFVPVCVTGTLAESFAWAISEGVSLFPGTELLPYAAIPTAVFVFFLLNQSRTKKDLAVTISRTFNLLNPQNILKNINNWLLLAYLCMTSIFVDITRIWDHLSSVGFACCFCLCVLIWCRIL